MSDRSPNRDFWRSLDDLAASSEFSELNQDEFPSGIEAPDDMSRRRFLQIMGASAALATLAGCSWPEEKIMPFAERPEGTDPGTPRQFATTFEMGPVALPVLATSYDGRPIKIDGNPDSPLSGGATNVFAQASVLDLYNPDRSQSVMRRSSFGRNSLGMRATWDDFQTFAKGHFPRLAGGGLAVLTEVTTSPAVWGMLEALQRSYPGTRVYFHEPVCRVNEMMGARLAFGTPARSQLAVDKARVIVDFDANFLQDHPTALRNNRRFARGRRPESGEMNRLYVYENTFTTTGGMADHRFPTPAGHIDAAVWALAAELVLGEGLPLPGGAGVTRAALQKFRGHRAGGKHVQALARDLMANRGASLLIAGMRRDPETHALIHVLNEALGNVGRTVSYQPFDMPQLGDIKALASDLDAGRVDTLLILGGNPAYDAPADLDFPAALQKAATRIHLAETENATSRLCQWHLPRAHYLESWGDATGWDGSHLAVQPLIKPLYDGRTVTEVLSLLADSEPRTAFAITRETFARVSGWGQTAPQDEDPRFEKKWRKFIHDGVLQGSARRGEPLALTGAPIAPPEHPQPLSAENLELSIHHDQSVFDGRFCDNAWLQEMPDFMTKLTWDNAALLSPATAAALGVAHSDLVELEFAGRKQEMAVYVLPGQAAWSVSVMLGYGRDDAGGVGRGAGFNAYTLRASSALHGGAGLKLTRTGRTYKLATTQDHHAMDQVGAQEIQKRVPGLVRQGDLEEYKEHPEFVDHMGIHHPPLESLWKEWDYSGYKWGMAVDLNVCNGCNACIIGCQAENNVAVVGKDEVARGREMAWIRLDRYFLGDPEDPECAQQPVACAQCELAPCEEVCPVAATMHSREGLNMMVYNRCVGTRYCSNNCPYKVRRFNWFNNFEDLTATQRLVLNPDVTVRARGVMEKCTYCVQRIEKARVEARVEGRKIRDGDITPACAQACPTDAIVFGDLNDPESRVSKLREVPRSYDLLAYLNIKPRTFYMARIRNPNPEIAVAAGHGAGHGEGHGAERGTEHGTEHGEEPAGHGHG